MKLEKLAVMEKPVVWRDELIEDGGRCLVMAPHPDDFDAVAVTLEKLKKKGWDIRLLVHSAGVSGVEDDYRGGLSGAEKIELREHEQLESCRRFGLDQDKIKFLRLSVDEKGRLIDSVESLKKVKDFFLDFAPDVVFLPHGNDSNSDHQLVYRFFNSIARQLAKPPLAMMNRDPKTVAMREDVFVPFEREQADWKAELLKCHDSQHSRNLNLRGYGFDDRIMQINRHNAQKLPEGNGAEFAECFELLKPTYSGQ